MEAGEAGDPLSQFSAGLIGYNYEVQTKFKSDPYVMRRHDFSTDFKGFPTVEVIDTN